MRFFTSGNPPVWSTYATATSPSTTTIVAELDSSNFLSTRGGQFAVYAYLGASTNATWWVEQCLSTGLGSTAIRQRVVLGTASFQHSQFVLKFDLESGDRVRVRVGSTFTGAADATLMMESIA